MGPLINPGEQQMRPDGWMIILIIALCISILIAWVNSKELKRQTGALLKAREQLSVKDGAYDKLARQMDGLTKLVDQRKIQFPWLVSAIADFHALEGQRDAKILERKKHPAVKAADLVHEHSRKRREAEYNSRIMRYRIEYYEKLFPWITEYVGDDVPDNEIDVSGARVEATDDPVKSWLNDAEYRTLSVTQRNQLAIGSLAAD